jgi:hypothetical protein
MGIINFQVDPGTAPAASTVFAAAANNYPVVCQAPHRSFARLREYSDDDDDDENDEFDTTETKIATSSTTNGDSKVEVGSTPSASSQSTPGVAGEPRPRRTRRRSQDELRPLRDLIDHDLFGMQIYSQHNVYFLVTVY